jgi:hypothetical protein
VYITVGRIQKENLFVSAVSVVVNIMIIVRLNFVNHIWSIINVHDLYRTSSASKTDSL